LEQQHTDDIAEGRVEREEGGRYMMTSCCVGWQRYNVEKNSLVAIIARVNTWERYACCVHSEIK
jgi:hypothetical protein